MNGSGLNEAALPASTQVVEGQANEPVPSLDAATTAMVKWVFATRAPGGLVDTPVKPNGTVPLAKVDADPIPISVHAITVRHKTVFNIVFKVLLRNRLVSKHAIFVFSSGVPMVIVP